MDPKYELGGMLLAPGASSSASSSSFPSSFPARDRHVPSSYPPPDTSFPAVDDHLVEPEVSREEIIRGRKIVTMGANPPHADTHVRADFLIMPHVHDDYIASSDLLTRVNHGSNFATDVSIRRKGLDPQTGVRYLEEISFEIVNEQSMRDITEKAEDLIRRGVRRVFAIFTKKGYVGEWSKEKREFKILASNGTLVDRLFIRPIAVQALIDAALAENEVALALWKKGNPTLVRIGAQERADGRKEGHEEGYKDGQAEGYKDGQEEGQREMLGRLLERRFGPLRADTKSLLEAADSDALRRWADRIWDAMSIDDVIGANK